MKILVATDAHIYETPDGRHWTPAIYGYSFWKRYLNVFDQVRVVARMKKVEKIEGKALPVDGPGVDIFPITFYQGPKELLKVYGKIHRELSHVADGCDVALFRMPSQTAQMVYSHVKNKMPTAGEIVYDPTDDLKRKDVSLFVRVLSWVISNNLKRFCREVNGVSYVTQKSIQKNYPSRARLDGESKSYFETYYSTITLKDDAFTGTRNYIGKKQFTIGFSSVSMNSNRKGEPVLIRAIKSARDRGFDISAVLIGDGSRRSSFEKLARELGIEKNIIFTGRLASAQEVKEVLLNADIYMFPSQAEGLPRGILEAMAIGLPVLSTPVGGIPEVIDGKYLFDPQDVQGFSNMICHLADNTSELNEMSKVNYMKSQEYSNKILQARRDDFYRKLLRLANEE